jgi:hypothetical protein
MHRLSFIKTSLLFICLITQSVSIYAQDAGVEEDLLASTKKDFFLVAGMGGIGAILGLSTLSFVEEPKDHFKNIIVGGAVGVIVGVGVVAWMQANKSQTQFDSAYRRIDKNPEFSTDKRLSWHRTAHAELNVKVTAVPATQLQFSF